MFASDLDLKAHMVEEHASDMTARNKKDARRIETRFDLDDMTGSGDGNRRHGQNRERDREPPEPGSSRNRRREGFGATLTTEPLIIVGPSPQPPLQPRPREEDHTPSSPAAEVNPVAAEYVFP